MIRKVRAGDMIAIYGIYAWYVENSTAIFDLEPLSYEQFSASLHDVLGVYPFFVAEHEGKVIGYAYAHKAFSKEAYRFCAELSIYFAPGSHRGMAVPLYEAVEDALRRQGCAWLISCITDSNEASIGFHKKLGFGFGGALPSCGLKFGTWHGVCWYQKKLNDDPRVWIDFEDLK